MPGNLGVQPSENFRPFSRHGCGWVPPSFLNTSLKDRTESDYANHHRGNEDAVFVVFVEAPPGGSRLRIREEVQKFEVLPMRAQVFNIP